MTFAGLMFMLKFGMAVLGLTLIANDRFIDISKFYAPKQS